MGEPDWRSRITIDPDVCHGKPGIKGTRIMVSIVLDYLSAGESNAAIVEQYPQLSEEDIKAVLRYASWLAREEEEPPAPYVAPP